MEIGELEKLYKQMIKGWHDTILKEMWKAPYYLYPKTMKVLEEMEKESQNDKD
jgi:hypothetical protein